MHRLRRFARRWERCAGKDERDLRALLWSSIDNDTSRDLDQIEVAERVDGGIRVRVGIADVSAAVLKDTPIDQHAAKQTQTVYTAVKNFSMLPTGVVDRHDFAE